MTADGQENLAGITYMLTEEGQTVLTLSHNNYNRGNYAAYVYRAGGWYLLAFPDDGLMTVDVRWWSAQPPPEVVK